MSGPDSVDGKGNPDDQGDLAAVRIADVQPGFRFLQNPDGEPQQLRREENKKGFSGQTLHFLIIRGALGDQSGNPFHIAELKDRVGNGLAYGQLGPFHEDAQAGPADDLNIVIPEPCIQDIQIFRKGAVGDIVLGRKDQRLDRFIRKQELSQDMFAAFLPAVHGDQIVGVQQLFNKAKCFRSFPDQHSHARFAFEIEIVIRHPFFDSRYFPQDGPGGHPEFLGDHSYRDRPAVHPCEDPNDRFLPGCQCCSFRHCFLLMIQLYWQFRPLSIHGYVSFVTKN